MSTQETFTPSAGRVEVGDWIVGHGEREIPLPRPAEVVEKHVSSGSVFLVLRFDDGEKQSLSVPSDYPVYLQPPF